MTRRIAAVVVFLVIFGPPAGFAGTRCLVFYDCRFCLRGNTLSIVAEHEGREVYRASYNAGEYQVTVVEEGEFFLYFVVHRIDTDWRQETNVAFLANWGAFENIEGKMKIELDCRPSPFRSYPIAKNHVLEFLAQKNTGGTQDVPPVFSLSKYL